MVAGIAWCLLLLDSGVRLPQLWGWAECSQGSTPSLGSWFPRQSLPAKQGNVTCVSYQVFGLCFTQSNSKQINISAKETALDICERHWIKKATKFTAVTKKWGKGQEKMGWFIPSLALLRSLLCPSVFLLYFSLPLLECFPWFDPHCSYFPYTDPETEIRVTRERMCVPFFQGKPGHWAINMFPCLSQTPPTLTRGFQTPQELQKALVYLSRDRQGTVTRYW